MPRYTISEEGSYRSVVVELASGERFISESGAMFMASDNVEIDVTTRNRGSGGLLGGVRRMMAGDSFFMSTYHTRDGGRGEVGLAPTLAGDVAVIECAGMGGWLWRRRQLSRFDGPGLAWIHPVPGVQGDVFSGESLFFLDVQGRGDLIVNAFGKMTEVEVDGTLVVDTGHLVAFEDSLEYTVRKAAGSWLQSMLSSEGSAMRFEGRGEGLSSESQSKPVRKRARRADAAQELNDGLHYPIAAKLQPARSVAERGRVHSGRVRRDDVDARRPGDGDLDTGRSAARAWAVGSGRRELPSRILTTRAPEGASWVSRPDSPAT